MKNRLSLPDAAKALGVTEYFLRTGVRNGTIPAYRPPDGRTRYLIDVEQVDAFLTQKAMENVRQEDPEEDIIEYGKLRKVK